MYPIVAEIDEPNAGKITGMLLEMSEGDVISIIEDRHACEEKVQSTLDVTTDSQQHLDTVVSNTGIIE